MNLEEVTIEGITLRAHSAADCAVQPCTIHAPTDHHLRSWQLHWRGDRGIFERLCPEHGGGHPDPDQFDFWERTNQEWQSIHGCVIHDDGRGCCAKR